MRHQIPSAPLLLSILAFGGACSGTSPPETVRAEVLAALTQFRSAILQRDSTLLSRFYTDEYVLTEDDGTVFSKAERLAALLGEIHFDSLKFADVKVRPYGGAAVVTYVVTTKLRERPGESFRFQVTMLWVKQSLGWQVAASHESFLEVTRN